MKINNNLFTGMNSIRTLAQMVNVAYITKAVAWEFVVDEDRKIDYTVNILTPTLFSVGMEHGFSLAARAFGKDYLNKVAPLFKDELQSGQIKLNDLENYVKVISRQYLNKLSGSDSFENIIKNFQTDDVQIPKIIPQKFKDMLNNGSLKPGIFKKFYKNWNACGALLGAFLAVFYSAYTTSKIDTKYVQPWEDRYIANGGNYKAVVYPTVGSFAFFGILHHMVKKATQKYHFKHPLLSLGLRWVTGIAGSALLLNSALTGPKAIARGEKKGPRYDTPIAIKKREKLALKDPLKQQLSTHNLKK